MPYTVFDELSITFDADTAKEIYAYVAANYPDQDRETFIWANMDFVKRTFNSKIPDFLEYIWEAIKNNYAAADRVEEPNKPILDVLVELFYDKDRASKIYSNVQNNYSNLNFDELIRANIDFAKKKQKKLGVRFLPYLQEAIEKNMAGYGENVQTSNA